MTTIDGTRAPGTILLDGQTLDWLDDVAAATGITPASVVRFFAAAAHAKLATGDVVTGQGTTRPPAPILEAVPARVLGLVLCSTGWDHPARWWIGNEGGIACCDDHVPDGWVRPGETVTDCLPPACATCGERSEHEVCS